MAFTNFLQLINIMGNMVTAVIMTFQEWMATDSPGLVSQWAFPLATVHTGCAAAAPQRSAFSIPGPAACWYMWANQCIFRD